MEVEFIAEFTEGMSRDRAQQIIKGKRTKRQRPCSPSHADCSIDDYTPDQSPVMLAEMSTEEDEDMANCLIMLAQSVSPVKEDKSDQIRRKTEKLSSRRFTEFTSFDVYECRTCNRTFPSFQALGGHRASHKKQKLNVEEKKFISVNFPPPLTEYSVVDHDQHKMIIEDVENNTSMIINNNVQKSPSSSPGFVETGITNNKGKVHECSICGSEFSSGQALGGHMRKHRPIPPSVNRTESVTVIEKSLGGSTSTLSLDLNFPPPEMADDVVQSKFQFTASSSQQHLVFSSRALVDCHY